MTTCPNCGYEHSTDYSRFLSFPSTRKCLSAVAQSQSGLTDDDVDAMLKMGHQSTTPAMRALRALGMVEWKLHNGAFITRLTRKGNPAKVNFLTDKGVDYMTHNR